MLRGTGLNVLLGVVPSTTSVGHGNSELNTRNERAGKNTSKALSAEESTNNDGGEHDKGTGGNHLGNSGLGGDGNATLVVGAGSSLHETGNGLELATDLLNHGEGGLTDRLHGHGREPVRKHGTEEETSEDAGIEDGGVDEVNLGAGNVGTEKSEGDKGGRANSEALANGGGGVAGGIKSISPLTDVLTHASHLSNTTGIVGDGAIGVDGETSGEGGEHAEGSAGNAEHAGEGATNIDGDGDGDGGNDAGLVAESETEDDVGGGASAASIGNVLNRLVAVGGEVLGLKADEETRPETDGNADEHVPVLDGLAIGGEAVSAGEGEGLGEGEEGDSEGDGGHEDGGDDHLELKGVLDLGNDLGGLEVGGDEGGEEADNDTGGGDDQGEEHAGVVVGLSESGDGGDDEGSASGLGERAEEIGTHTGNITDVVTDVVGNDGGVTGVVLGDVLLDLADEISTDISGLGVDTTTDAAEEGNGGTTKTVAGDGLEETLPVIAVELLENGDDDVKVEETEAGKEEAHNGTGAESAHEGGGNTLASLNSGTSVGIGGNLHAKVTGKDGGDGTGDKGNGRENTLPDLILAGPALLRRDRAQEREDSNGHEDHEDTHVVVFSGKESIGTLLDGGLDISSPSNNLLLTTLILLKKILTTILAAKNSLATSKLNAGHTLP
mmetsp:Transcript_23491/g.41781  ORF Transcript_23491/g.41781 Transcript_23491/m.41781 type:complete len:667 (-) Transcript_23491:134-2134(-)